MATSKKAAVPKGKAAAKAKPEKKAPVAKEEKKAVVPEKEEEEHMERQPAEDEVKPNKKVKVQEEEYDLEKFEEEAPVLHDDDDIDETYSDLDDDQLLELALKDDEDEVVLKKPTDAKTLSKRRKKTFSKANVLYLGHIPHGFFEHEMKAFFSQFGKVLQVRVSRSKKTGKSRGYAFVQFLHEDVAKIVQKTMHGYIMLGKSIVCQHVPEEHVHEKMFLGGLSGKDSVVETYKDARQKRVLAHGVRSTTEKGIARRAKRLTRSDAKRKERLAAKGIKYEFAGYSKDE